MFDLDRWLAVLLVDTEWPVLHVANNIWVVHLAANKTLSVENGVLGVGVVGVFGAVTDTRGDGSVERRDSAEPEVLTVARRLRS